MLALVGSNIEVPQADSVTTGAFGEVVFAYLAVDVSTRDYLASQKVGTLEVWYNWSDGCMFTRVSMEIPLVDGVTCYTGRVETFAEQTVCIRAGDYKA